MKKEKWQKLIAVMDLYKDNIKYILSGHVHFFCGNTGRLNGELEHCPICGAPLDKIIKI